MSKQERQEQPIKELNTPAFVSGFFNGTEALQFEIYNCKKALDSLKSEGYTVNSKEGQDFINGWRYARV